MENEKKGQEEEKGFVVRDKRFSAKEETDARPEASDKGGLHEDKTEEQTEPLPEITFTNLILSISTSALIQLGEIEDPISRKPSKNLPLAKQTIDLIGMLKDKTKGNLAPEEEKLVEHVLYDLRLRYVKASE
jgi:hypothetical protein